MHPKSPRDVYSDVTAKIIATIETDRSEPHMPWHRSTAPLVLPLNIESGRPYQGINIVTLWCAAELCGYHSNIWGTYRQWQEQGAQVRKGEKAALVVFYKEYATTPDPESADDDGKRRVARASFAFNAQQVEGFTPPPPPPDLGPVDRLHRVDQFVTTTQADIRHGGDRAYYRPSQDFIQMPHEGLFTGTSTSSRTEGYYATLLHELTHWAGAKNRLNRQFGKKFGDDGYAMEEMVAELGAAFLAAEFQITPEPRADHAHYLGHWLNILKADNRAIFTAAAKAAEAVRYLAALRTGGAHGQG